MTILPEAARALRRELADVPDVQLRRIVALIDSLPRRGIIDALIDPLRPRLGQLRPPRPLRLARLMFMPLDPIIVPPPQWRRGMPFIPRSVIVPLETVAQAALPEKVRAMFAAAAGCTTRDLALVESLGALLWPALPGLMPEETPENWSETGLQPADWPGLREMLVGLWQVSAPLWRAQQAAADGPPEALVIAALEPALGQGGTIGELALSVLLARASAPAAVAQIAMQLSSKLTGPAERMLENWLQRPLPDLDSLPPEEGANSLFLLARTLSALEEGDFGKDGVRRAALYSTRVSARQHVGTYFADKLGKEIAAPLAQQGGSGPMDEKAVAALEQTARDLRRYIAAARELGDPGVTERPLAPVLGQLKKDALAATDPLRRTDMVRLVELLEGSEAAAKLMPPPSPAEPG